MTPSDTIHTPYDFIEIQDHRYLNNQTTYLVTYEVLRCSHKNKLTRAQKKDSNPNTSAQSRIKMAYQPTRYTGNQHGN